MNRSLANPILALFAFLVLAAPPASAQDVVLDAVDRGWYNTVDGHRSNNKNTLTGICCSDGNHNAYFVFDFGGVVEPIEALTLRLELEGYTSSDPQESVAIFDVTTDPVLLQQTHFAGPFALMAYQDLQSGAMYATTTVTQADRRSVIDIPLDAAAVADANAALGGLFAVGVHLVSPRSTVSEWVRWSFGGERRTHQLVITPGAFFRVGLQPATALGPPGGMHTVTATLADQLGDPVPGAGLRVDVLSGPNAGVGGALTTDAVGTASFTYVGGGGAGIDVLVASFEDDEGNLFESPPVRHVWDFDCNENALPDTCDVDCGGFGGQCSSEFPSCGGSDDRDGNGQPDECNQPPVCDGAAPTDDRLWPPSHRLRPVSVTGVVDPDGDPVSIAITSVHQDEAVDDPGSGNTCPDALGLGSDTARLAAERSGTGDGRVYHVEFAAEDGHGGACTGIVQVCVPHDARSDCGDGGMLFDAAICSNLEGAAPH